MLGIIVAVVAALLIPGTAFAAPVPNAAAVSRSTAGSTSTPNAAAAVANKKATSPTSTGSHPTKQACAAATKGKASCLLVLRTDVTRSTGVHPAITPTGYGPADLDSAYSLPSATAGSGASVAIVDAFGYPTAEADLAVYRAQYGLPACTTANGCLKLVDQRGGTDFPPSDPGWNGEEALDLDMVSAVCPNCHITLVETDDNSIDNLGAGVNEAVTLGAKYVSNSYAGDEDPSELQLDDAYYNHPGVVVTASSDDLGYGAAYPAASPYVTGVGGTTLVKDSSTRGWSESAWAGAGSGCSAYEPKPAFQTDTGCANRAIADVSAVADPNTPVATYEGGNWGIAGGTSVASPIIAATYALAGPPSAGTYPVSYPYRDTAALNDVTSGSNGTCSPAYLCAGGPGYDGPTGLGTPNGVAAFVGGPTGFLAGAVHDATGAPLAGAEVSTGDYSTATDAQGGYSLAVPVGTYSLTATKFGYSTGTATGVAVVNGQTVTDNFTLTAQPRVVVSGVVRDGSGHGWPMYAQVQVAGQPTTAVYTDPTTGHYQLSVPANATYSVQVDPVYTGYVAASAPVTVGAGNVGHDVSVPVDASTCSALGYSYQYSGATQTFDGSTAPAGWTVQDNQGNGQTWAFTDAGARGNLTGGTGGFAIVDSDHYGSGNIQDTSLVSPVIDLSQVTSPTIQFDNDYYGFPGQSADVDYTLDGGATWTNAWHQDVVSVRGPGQQSIALPGAAGQSAVQVRFHFTGNWGYWWELDNVFVGSRVCAPTPGGLVIGHVTDHNTGAGVNGASVISTDHPTDTAVTKALDDPAQGAGFFWLFSSETGSHPFAATAGNYASATQNVSVAPDWTTPVTYSLNAGRVVVKQTSVSATVAWQGTASKTVKVTNTGSAPADVKISEQSGTFVPQVQGPGAALQNIRGDYTPGPMVGLRAQKRQAVAAIPATPADAPWQAVADYPTTVMDNGVAEVGGKIYSFTGIDGLNLLSTNYVYDPSSQAWTSIPNLGTPRERPVVAAVGTKIYVIGGWGADGNPVATTEVYDTAAGTWSTAAAEPTPYAGSGVAVVGGKVYVVGGCGPINCGVQNTQVYDPAANTWTAAANAPAATAWDSCGGIAGVLYCAGGTTDAAPISAGYSFDPATNIWSPIAALPETLWGSGSTVSGGKLLLSGGVGNGALTNAGFSYDPAANSWTALPNSNNTVYRGGSACGLYKIGGSTGQFSAVSSDELLPGYDQCDENVSIPWLTVSPTTATLAPGASATFTVTLNADVDAITQPGTYTAGIAVTSATPYPVPAIPVSLVVKPPSTWGEITGTVTGQGTSGTAPIAGATVQIDTWASTYTLRTDANGQYELWLDVRNNPLTLIVAKDGWQPQTKTAKLTKLATITDNFTLLPTK
ncbi:MAG TPA: carboxypeptidase regulatory-like domain-containing protein [Pseudonocardiaceae bacterium]|nr:carboxypeptidase regulatory-like domain-containing protein [Pseudonocardiaceae bacterium]